MFNPIMPLFAGRRLLSNAISSQFAVETEMRVVNQLNEALARFHPGTVVDTLHLSGRNRSVMLDNIGLPHKAVYEREAQKAREAGEDKRKEAELVWEKLCDLSETHQAVVALRATVALLERQVQIAHSRDAGKPEIARLEAEAKAARRELEETEMPLKVLEAEYDRLMEEANNPVNKLTRRFITAPDAKLNRFVRKHASRDELREAARLQEKVKRTESLQERQAQRRTPFTLLGNRGTGNGGGPARSG